MSNVQFTQDNTYVRGYAATVPLILKQTCKQTSQAGSGTSDVYLDDDGGTYIHFGEGEFSNGLALRFTMGGSKSGANSAMIVHLSVGGTQVVSITADDATAVEWMAMITVAAKTVAAQRCVGQVLTDTADPAIEYAAGTVDCKLGVNIKAQIQSQNAGDTVTCEYCLVELMKAPTAD